MGKLTFLFDCDGVVLDTESQYSAIWEQIGKKYYPQSTTFAKDIKGMSLTDIFLHYFHLSTQQLDIRNMLEDFEKNMDYHYVIGVETFLTTARYNGIQTALVTSSNNAKMQCVYKAHPEIKSFFNHIFTADDVTCSKPAPDCFLKAAEWFNVDIHHCVIFEDSVNGLIAAKSSGAKVVGVTTTHPKEKIRKYCNLLIPDFEEISPLQLQIDLALL